MKENQISSCPITDLRIIEAQDLVTTLATMDGYEVVKDSNDVEIEDAKMALIFSKTHDSLPVRELALSKLEPCTYSS